MAKQVIIINRRKYAAGLFWQPVSGGQNVRALARHLGKLISGRTKYFTEYKSTIGVASSAIGHTSRMPSAAAEIANTFSEYNSFLSAFVTDSGIYVVAMRSGIIVLDKLFADENSARYEFDALLSLPDWGIVVAPASWNIPRGVEKHIADVIIGTNKFLLAPISQAMKFIASITMIAILFGALWWYFENHITNLISPHPAEIVIDESVRAAYLRRLEARDTVLTQVVRPAHVPVAAVMPFDNIPDPSLRAQQCMDSITFLMGVIPGWVQQEAECTKTATTVHVHRRHGALSDIFDYVIEQMPGIEITQNSESDVLLTMYLDELPGLSRLEESGGDVVARHINSIFQLMGHDADVRQSVETIRHGNRVDMVNVVLISAQSALQPYDFIQIFKDFDAVVLSTVRWTNSVRRWNYEVRIYVK